MCGKRRIKTRCCVRIDVSAPLFGQALLKKCKVRQAAMIGRDPSLRPSGYLQPSGYALKCLPDLQVIENKKGSSGRTRTYNPPVNRGIPCCCWELRNVADSLIVLHLRILMRCWHEESFASICGLLRLQNGKETA